jgi:hypothetical protein
MRAMSSAMLAAITSPGIQPAFFVMATFATGPVYLWSGIGSIVWNGHTWLGVGTLGSISVAEEGSTVEAKGITIGLSGFDSSFLTAVLGEFQLGLPVVVYLGLFADGALIASPITAWAGRMDQPTITVGGETADIKISCENRLIDLNTSVQRRYTNDDQQLVAPGDLGLSFQSGIQEVVIYWGVIPNSKNNV